MVVLIVREYEEIIEITGPFENGGEAADYEIERRKFEPNYFPSHYDVREPIVMRPWRA